MSTYPHTQTTENVVEDKNLLQENPAFAQATQNVFIASSAKGKLLYARLDRVAWHQRWILSK